VRILEITNDKICVLLLANHGWDFIRWRDAKRRAENKTKICFLCVLVGEIEDFLFKVFAKVNDAVVESAVTDGAFAAGAVVDV